MWSSVQRAAVQTSTMSFSQESCVVDRGSLRKKSSLWYRHSLRGSGERHRHEAGSLPRAHRPKLHHSSSLVDYADPQRITVTLEKQDNETFGFEIQTYGLQQRNTTATEMCTFVCRVHEDSAAESAGLTAGDVIVTINGVSVEGSSHQQIVDLIGESNNSLKMETVCGSVVKRIELEKRLNLLKQTLREKLLELQTLTLQEKRLTRGRPDDGDPRLSSNCSPAAGRRGLRISSDSSFRSATTDDSDLASVFGDAGSPGPFSAASSAGGDGGCFFPGDFSSQGSARRFSSCSGPHQNQHHHQSLGRSSSSSLAGSSGCSSSSSSSSCSSASPSWEETRISSLFGTLPRRSRKASVRKHIFKLIPGLQRSVEEEEA